MLEAHVLVQARFELSRSEHIMAAGVCTNLDGLSAAWDSCAQVRFRIREFCQMCLEKPADDEKPAGGDVGKTVANLKYNSFVIEPLVPWLKLFLYCALVFFFFL